MLISRRFLVREKCPLFLQKWSIFLVSKGTSSALFFSGNFDVFHGAETRLQSAACEGDMRGAREKHPVSTVSLCIKNKPTPKGSTLRAICTQAQIQRDEFLRAYERS
jgi:hypothetical protein